MKEKNEERKRRKKAQKSQTTSLLSFPSNCWTHSQDLRFPFTIAVAARGTHE